MNRQRNLPMLLTLGSALLTTVGCTTDVTDSDDALGLRDGTIVEAWHIAAKQRLPEIDCDAYWAEQCSELSSDQCLVAKDRFACTDMPYGVLVRDAYGDVEGPRVWSAFASGDAEPVTTSEAPANLCGSLPGLDSASCEGMARAAELAASRRDDLLERYGQGGFASLTIRDDVFVIEPFEPAAHAEDLVVSTAAALGWKVPHIGDGSDLGDASGLTLPPNTVLTIRPDGGVTVTCDFGGFFHQPQPQTSANTFFETMDASTVHYYTNETQYVHGWVAYAMLWKMNMDGLFGSFDFNNPCHASWILLGEETKPNFCEATRFTNYWGQAYDPNGEWYSVDYDDPLTGLAFSALAMRYWGTPVFVSVYWEPPPSLAPIGAWYREFALEQLTFQHPTAYDFLDLCGISPFATAQQALSQFQTCDLTGLSVVSGRVTAWEGNLSPQNTPALLHKQSISAADLIAAYAGGFWWDRNTPSNRVGELIFDPPATASQDEIDAVVALAELFADEMRAQVPMEELVQ